MIACGPRMADRTSGSVTKIADPTIVTIFVAVASRRPRARTNGAWISMGRSSCRDYHLASKLPCVSRRRKGRA